MAAIITVEDLPDAVQANELVDAMVAGANAKASRVAPCLVSPVAEWNDATAYTVGQTVFLPDGGAGLEVTTAGTSGATAPVAPVPIGTTVTDGTVVWTSIAPTLDQLAEARLVLIGAVKRWADAGAGALQAQTAGPFGMTIDTRQRTGFNLWPSEIESLQDICRSDDFGGAFSVDTAPGGTAHLAWCSYSLGALYCSCGVDIAGEPIYELG